MKAKNIFWGLVEAVLWYYFAYVALSFIADPLVSVKETAVRLVITAYLAAWACPLMRNSDAWRRVFSS